MADTIKGIEIKIGADTTDFLKDLKKVDKSISKTQREVANLKKGLQLEFNDKKFITAQKKVQEILDTSAEKAEAIRKQLKYLEDTGKIDTQGYNDLANELIKAENQAILLKAKLEEIKQLKFDNLATPFKTFGDSISNAGKKVAGLSIAAAGALTGITALGKKAIKYGDDIATLGVQYGVSAEAIQKFNYVALQTDTDVNALYQSLVKIREGIADIVSGEQSIRGNALQSLGIDFSTVKDTEEQFYLIIDALSKMEDKTLMVGLANDIFEAELANKLIPLISSGSEAIKEYIAEFGELGALSDEQVAALGSFDNVLNKLNTQFKNAGIQIGTAFLPIMETFAKLLSEKLVPSLQKITNWFNSLSLSQQKVIVGTLGFIAILSPLLLLIGKLSTGIGNLIIAIPKLSNVFSLLAANPIVAMISGLIILFGAMYAKNEQFRESINKLVSVITKGLSPILKTVANLLNQISPIIELMIQSLANRLAPTLNLIATLLEPILNILTPIFNLITGIIDGIMFLTGKGWLWGRNKEESSNNVQNINKPPTFDVSDYVGMGTSNSSVVNNNNSSSSNDAYNIVINVNANDYANTDDLVDALSKKLAIKIQSRN